MDVRLSAELWDAAAEVAAAEGETRAAIRDCLARCIRRTRRRQLRGHHTRGLPAGKDRINA